MGQFLEVLWGAYAACRWGPLLEVAMERYDGVGKVILFWRWLRGKLLVVSKGVATGGD